MRIEAWGLAVCDVRFLASHISTIARRKNIVAELVEVFKITPADCLIIYLCLSIVWSKQKHLTDSTYSQKKQTKDKELIKSKIKTNVYQIKPDSNVALHKHQKYDEIFYCIKGEVFGVLENEEKALTVGEYWRIRTP